MNYTVVLAIFPAWKAPVPLNTIGKFATFEQASAAGQMALLPIAERELSSLGDLKPTSAEIGGGLTTSIDVPEGAVHGYLIYEDGVEISNCTTLDIAVERAALKLP
ncbi:MAG: hypothetical protein K2Z25_23100 [Beijerinckiaceae bacterium]|nr:hypothetical protein [Beijerinckiaceae bacterium]